MTEPITDEQIEALDIRWGSAFVSGYDSWTECSHDDWPKLLARIRASDEEIKRLRAAYTIQNKALAQCAIRLRWAVRWKKASQELRRRLSLEMDGSEEYSDD